MAFLRRDIGRGGSRHVATGRARKFLDLCDMTCDRFGRDEILFAEWCFLSQAVEVTLRAVALDCPRRARMTRVFVADGCVLDGEGVLVGAGRALSRHVFAHGFSVARRDRATGAYPQVRKSTLSVGIRIRGLTPGYARRAQDSAQRYSESESLSESNVMTHGQSEAFSRVLIDKALESSDWDLLDSKQVVFEMHTGNGRADYLLKDKLGRILCVLEAKREDLDPYDAKEQARGYAENLKAPFIILSNGREHWFWNYERADQRDAYRIERLPSRNNLERLRLKNLQPPRPLQSEVIRPDYLRHLKSDLTLRRYQIEAMDEIARLFDATGRR